jgi:hypothetical protein
MMSSAIPDLTELLNEKRVAEEEEDEESPTIINVSPNTPKKDDNNNNNNNKNNASEVVFNILDKNQGNIDKYTEMAMTYLCFLKEPQIICKSKLAKESIDFIGGIATLKKTKHLHSYLNKHNFEAVVLLNLLNYHYDHFWLHMDYLQKQVTEDESIKDKISDGLFYMQKELAILINLTNSSIKYCQKIIDLKFISILMKYVTGEFCIKYLKSTDNKSVYKNAGIDKVIRFILGTLHNTSRVYDKTKDDCTEMNDIKVLVDIETLNTTFSNQVYMIFAHIASDEQIEALTVDNTHKVVGSLSKIIKKCIAPLENKTKPMRSKITYDNTADGSYSVIKCNYNKISWHLIELLQGLYHLAVNDSMKNKMYFEFNLSQHLRVIIYYGNQAEIEYGLKLLWQLCFDKDVARDVFEDNQLNSMLTHYLTVEGSSVNVKKYCNGILWTIKKRVVPIIEPQIVSDEYRHSQQQQQQQQEQQQQQKRKKQHIMISYNSKSRAKCLEIKKELELKGFLVWIDVEQMHGSTLEAMATAIENSWCVLICMSESYKQSANCRAEAEFAFQCGKSIVPLIMQENYKPDGW